MPERARDEALKLVAREMMRGNIGRLQLGTRKGNLSIPRKPLFYFTIFDLNERKGKEREDFHRALEKLLDARMQSHWQRGVRYILEPGEGAEEHKLKIFFLLKEKPSGPKRA